MTDRIALIEAALIDVLGRLQRLEAAEERRTFANAVSDLTPSTAPRMIPSPRPLPPTSQREPRP